MSDEAASSCSSADDEFDDDGIDWGAVVDTMAETGKKVQAAAEREEKIQKPEAHQAGAEGAAGDRSLAQGEGQRPTPPKGWAQGHRKPQALVASAGAPSARFAARGERLRGRALGRATARCRPATCRRPRCCWEHHALRSRAAARPTVARPLRTRWW